MQQHNGRGGRNLSQQQQQQNANASVISRAFSIATGGQPGAPPIFSTTAIGGAPVGGVHHHLLPGQVGQMAAGQALPTAAYFVSPGDLSSVGNAAIQLMQGPGPQGIPASASGSQQHPIVGVSAADYYQQYGSANAATNVPARQRKLQVDDALSYLEQVRQQFADNPEVYNDFLEVMKEFKSHAIDTQGVIRRVSRLFSAHPNLITGFNTFLPPGFEVRVNGSMTVIIEPTGVTSFLTNEAMNIGPSEQQQQQNISSIGSFQQQQQRLRHASPLSPTGPYGGLPTTAAAELSASQKQQQQVFLGNLLQSGQYIICEQPPPNATATKQPLLVQPAMQHQQISAAAIPQPFDHNQHQQQQNPQQMGAIENDLSSSTIGDQEAQNVASKQLTSMQHAQHAQQIDIKQALEYLNKIKSRFANRPQLYNDFLSILGEYQRGTREDGTQIESRMTENEVYNSVSRLFENEVDLLRDFNTFLPDVAQQQRRPVEQPQGQAAMAELISQGGQIGHLSKGPHSTAAEATAHPCAALTVAGDQQKVVAAEKRPIEQQPTQQQRKEGGGGGEPPPKKQQLIPPVLPVGKKRLTETQLAALEQTKRAKIITKVSYDTSLTEILEDIPLKEFIFFEKVNKSLNNEVIFKNFLRCLLLYNKSLVSRNELIELVTPFLTGFPDLLKHFKELVGSGPRSSNSSAASAMNQPKRQQQEKIEDRLPSELASQIDYATCKRLGVSYRSLPDNYERPVSSGRTPLCDQVLNDTWVSFPSWSSEDTSSVSSKKSQFEDFMYRTEDERFEVDILIEVNTAAITALDIVKRRIDAAKLPPGKPYTMEPNFGCTSPTLMRRAVKKLYGEHATKVMESLRENPLVAVPQVLKRLREKDVEWRAVREEFNVIWREQIDKNYLKSLDHQAATFKANDVKFIRNKQIIQQLEQSFDERQTRIEETGRFEAGPNMVLEYPEMVATAADDSGGNVVHDASELIVHHVKRQPNLPKREKQAIKRVLRCLVPRLFGGETESMSDDDDENGSVGAGATTTEGGTSGCTGDKSDDDMPAEFNGGNKKKTTTRARVNDSSPQSQALLLENQSKKEAERDEEKAEGMEIDHREKGGAGGEEKRMNEFGGYTLFFGTNQWILFQRLHLLLCERLALLKRTQDELVEEYECEQQARLVQAQVYAQKGPGLEAELINAVDVHIGLRELKKPLKNPRGFYASLLQEIKNLLDGLIDSASFEDSLRSMFGTRAYVLFTVDRLITAATRQLQNLVGDETSTGAIQLFNRYRASSSSNLPSAAALDRREYADAAEKLLVNQNCFKMLFLHLAQPRVTVELLNTDEEEEGDGDGDVDGEDGDGEEEEEEDGDDDDQQPQQGEAEEKDREAKEKGREEGKVKEELPNSSPKHKTEEKESTPLPAPVPATDDS